MWLIGEDEVGAASSDLEILFIQMVDEIIWLRMNSFGSRPSRRGGGAGQPGLCGGREALEEAPGQVGLGLLSLSVVEGKDLVFRAKVAIDLKALSTERKLSRREASVRLLIKHDSGLSFKLSFESKPLSTVFSGGSSAQI